MRILACLILLSSFHLITNAQEPGDKAPGSLIIMDTWRYRAGDDPVWATQDFNDSEWKEITISEPLKSTGNGYGNIFWLRKTIRAEQLHTDSLYALLITQFGASEIYVNGRLIRQFGTINPEGQSEMFNPHARPLPIQLNNQGINVIAIRFVPDMPSSDWVISRTNMSLLQIHMQLLDDALVSWEEKLKQSRFTIARGVVSAVFSLLFLMLYVFFPKQILYLFYGLFNLFLMLISVDAYYQETAQYDLGVLAWLTSGNVLTSRLIGMSALLFLLYALNRMRPLFWWYIGFTLLVDFPLTQLLPVEYMLFSSGLRGMVGVICIWLAYHAFRSERREDILIGILACTVVLVNFRLILEAFWGLETSPLFTFLPPVLTTLTIVTYLAIRNANMHKDLERQLVQVQQLSEENLRSEQEKQQILNSQKADLERQVEERTASLNQQKWELQATLDELKATQAQLIQSEKMASLGELTAGIAHEIQNPLNFVNNFSEVNKELLAEMEEAINKENFQEARLLAKDIVDNQEKINFHGKRADGIVKSMLQHSRSSSGKMESIDINALCDEYLRLAYHGYRAKDKSFNAKFETDFDTSLPLINAVPQDIGRVVLNLINNAFYAVNEKARMGIPGYEPAVTVSTKLISPSGGLPDGQGKAREVIITVKDNGPGIPDSIKEKIFQPFFTTKPTGQGTGLGLSLSYDVVKAHGGEIIIESLESRGTSFIISLPVG